MLLELLYKKLAPAIAKAIFYIWLPEPTSDAVASLQDGIIDVFKDRPADQNKIKRQIEQISETLVEEIEKILGKDFDSDDINKEAVVIAILNAITASNITSELIVNLGIEPKSLHDYIKSKANLVGFSSDEEYIFMLSLRNLCEYLIEIYSKFPDFNTFVFSELLKNDRYLIEVTNSIQNTLNELHRQVLSNNPEEKSAYFEANYRNAVKRKLDRLELAGIDLRATSHHEQSLTISYVTCNLKRNDSKVNGDDNGNMEEDMINVDKALIKSKRLLVMGMAGSGKTTFLNWVAIQSAMRKFKEELLDLNTKIPFFIPLRMTKGVFPKPENFIDYIASAISGEMPRGWVHEKLRSGNAIILIDGVDEISQRQEMTEWLRDLVEEYPDAIFIVTSRPSSIDVQVFRKLNFDDAELLPMTLSDIDIFVDRWHLAATNSLSEEKKIEGREQAEKLKLMIRDKRSIRSLATNPLLCAMLCILHRDRSGQVPSDRITLYDACCEMLIYRRDTERKIPSQSLLTDRQKRLLLQKLAYYFVRNGWSEITFKQAEDRLAQELLRLEPPIDKSNAHNELVTFIRRSGLLREPSPNKVDFAHRTFQEFLAADEVLSQNDIGLLVSKATDDQWREVAILAVGRAGYVQRKEIMQSLIKTGDDSQSEQRKLYHLVAIACMENITDLDNEIKEEINTRIAKLVPPHTMTDAKALVAAGDLALNAIKLSLLKLKSRPMSATTTAATVRTLSLIGGDNALNLLEKIAVREERQTVIKELMRGWDYFDEDIYGNRIISKLKFDWVFISSVNRINYVKYAKHVSFHDFTARFDLNIFKHLVNSITSLYIRLIVMINSENNYVNFSPLKSLKNLKRLDIYVESIYEYDFKEIIPNNELIFSDLPESLENLKVINNFGKIFIEYTDSLTLLQEVKLSGHQISFGQNTFKSRKHPNLQTMHLRFANINNLDTILHRIHNCENLLDVMLDFYSPNNNLYVNLNDNNSVFSSVKFLKLSNIQISENLSKMFPNVTEVILRKTKGFNIEHFSKNKFLENIVIIEIKDLEYLPNFSIIKSLKRVMIIKCASLSSFETLKNISEADYQPEIYLIDSNSPSPDLINHTKKIRFFVENRNGVISRIYSYYRDIFDFI